MVATGSQKVGSSDCRSLGSNQHPSGRSAKVSIGIAVEKEKSSVMASAYAQHVAEKRMECKGRAVADNAANLEIKEVDYKGDKNSDWVSSTFSCCGTSNIDACRVFTNQVPVLQSVECTNRTLSGLACEKKRKKDGDIERDGGLAFASGQEANLINQEIGRKEPGDVDNRSTGSLKMKLWEILGGATGVPSENEHQMNSPELQENKENAYVDQNGRSAKGTVAGPIHSSDPIETDSESPNQTIRRPATRSMTRKRCPNKVVQKSRGALNDVKMLLSSGASHYKHKGKESLRGSTKKNNISFDDGKGNKRILKQNVSGHPEMAHGIRRVDVEFKKRGSLGSDHQHSLKKNLKGNGESSIFVFDEGEGVKYNLQKKSSSNLNRPDKSRKVMVELGKFDYAPRSNSMSNLQKRNESVQSFLSSAKAPSHSNKVDSPCLPCPIGKQTMQTEREIPIDNQHSEGNTPSAVPLPNPENNENIHITPLKMENGPWGNVNSSSISKFLFQHDKEACSPMKSKADPSDDLQSPTLAWNATPIAPSNKVASSTLATRNMNFIRNIRESDIMDNTEPGCLVSESKTDYSDDTREIDELRETESIFVAEKETNKLSLSPTARQDSESTGEVLKTKDLRPKDKWTPSVDSPEKSPFRNYKRRMVFAVKYANSENGETNDVIEASGNDIHDSFARSVNQLALALRRLKSKIQLHANKKSCEILAVVADKIKQHLQDVESQINAEMGRSTGTIKSKRKRLESRFEEQQERLGLIHEKFQEEVNLHLLNCRTTIDELEAQSIEMKGSADKQKASHRKLLVHVEEAVKDQLTAAETSIAAVRKESQKKINSLKFALKMWLDEGTVC